MAAPADVSTEPVRRTARHLAILGPTVVRQNGAVIALRPRERDVLAALAVDHPRPMTASRIVEILWPAGAPATAKQAVQNHVARLRSTLGVDAVLTDAGGYWLGNTWTIDLTEFDAYVRAARRGSLDRDHVLARVLSERALALVRGDAFADLPESDVLLAERSAREQVRVAVEEDRLLDLIAAGELTEAITSGRAFVTREPYRETGWAALALALCLDGQRRESVQALQQGRETVREVSGLELGPAVVQLERMILDDDPALRTSAPSVLIRQTPAGRPGVDGLFIGRSAVLAEIHRHLLNSVTTARPISISIVGEHGIGKTALARRVELQASIDGWHVVTASCTARPSRVLEPLGDIVREIVDDEPDPADAFDVRTLRDVAPLWSSSDRPPSGDGADAVVDVLVRRSRRTPTLIVIDDAQHLSSTVRLIVRQASASSATLAVVYVSTTRDVDDGADVVISLTGLDIDDTRRLLEVVADTAPSDETVAAIHAITSGNPALVREAAADEAGARAGRARPGAEVWRLAVDGLDPIARQVAAWVAVGGGSLPAAIVAELLGDDVRHVHRAIDAARVRGVLHRTSGGDIGVASAALSAFIVDALDVDDRLDAHEAIGRAYVDIEGNDLAAAPHFVAAVGRDPERAIATAERAARTAFGATMYREAAEFLRQAVGIAETTLGLAHQRTLSLLLERADSLRRLGDPAGVDDVWLVVERARSADDFDSFALAAAGLCKLGPLTEHGVTSAEVAAVVEEAIARCERPDIRAYCAGQATLFHSFSGRIDLCRSYFELGLDNARETGDDRTLISAIGNAYVSLNHPDDWPWRAELASEMLMLAERVDDDDARCEALHLHFASQIEFCDPLLRSTFGRQEALAASLRSAPRRWMAGYQRACIAHLDGRFDDALDIHEEMLVDAPVGPSRAATTYWMNMLSVRMSQGRGGELTPVIDAMVADYPTVPGWRAVAAWLAALAGDHERVTRECELTGAGRLLLRDQSWSGAAMLLGRAVARLDDMELNHDLTELLAPHSGLFTWVGSSTVGPFDLALAELAIAAGDTARATRHLDSAQRCVDRLNAVAYRHEIDAARRRLLPVC